GSCPWLPDDLDRELAAVREDDIGVVPRAAQVIGRAAGLGAEREDDRVESRKARDRAAESREPRAAEEHPAVDGAAVRERGGRLDRPAVLVRARIREHPHEL